MNEPSNPQRQHDAPYDLLYETMRFIEEQAHLPNKEVALAGSLALMAGVCGRAYEVSGTGLNQYIAVLAQTGTGKSEAANGIDKILTAASKTVPGAVHVVASSRIASGPALLKHLASTPCCLAILGEFGLLLQQLTSPKASPHLMELKSVLLDLFSKSGPGQILRPSIYSDTAKNTPPIFSPAFTIFAESTAEEYDKALNEQSIANGLLPRFFVIESHEQRPPSNEFKLKHAPPLLVERWATLIARCLALAQEGHRVGVELSDAAKASFQEFDDECRHRINSAEKDVTRHLWNRAHIKALKVAALVAVGRNPYAPRIESAVALWAIGIEKSNTQNQIRKFEFGEVGEQAQSEQVQQQRVREIVRYWLVETWEKVERYGIGKAELHDDRVIPYSYISKRLTNDSAFKNSKLGATSTLRRTIEELVKFGELVRVTPTEADKRYGTRMELYMVDQSKRILDS